MPRVEVDDNTRALVGLETLGVSLVHRGANKKRIALTKGIEGHVEKILEIIKSFKADGEAKLVELCKGLSAEAVEAVKVAHRVLAAHQEDLTPEVLKGIFADFGVEVEAPKSGNADALIKNLDGKVKEAVETVLKAQREEVEKQRKKNEDLEKIIKTERDARMTREFVSKAEKDFAKMPGKPEDLGALMKDLNDVCEEKLFERVVKTLGDAHAAIAQGKLLEERGRTGGRSSAGGDAMAKVEDIAKKLREADSKLSRAAAITKALASNPKLYEEYLQEQQAAR